MATGFPLMFQNHQPKTMARIVQIDLAVLVGGLIIVATAGVVSWTSLVWSIPFMCVLLGVIYVRYGWLRGEALVDAQGVSVKAKTGRQFYPWQDILTIGLVTMGQRDRWTRRWVQFCGVKLDEPMAELLASLVERDAEIRGRARRRPGTDIGQE